MINLVSQYTRDNKNKVNAEWRIVYYDKTKRRRGNNKVNS